MADHIRILAYNILNGCREHSRRQNLYAFLNHAGADIVGLVEADGWHTYEPAIAARLGYPYHTAPRSLGETYEKHQVILSRFPITSRRYLPLRSSLDGWHNGALLAHIDIRGKPLDVLLCHLKHDSEPVRIQEIHALLPQVDPGRNTVLMGDFNTFAPDGGYDAAYEHTLEEYVKQYGSRRDLGYILPRLRATRDLHDFATARQVLAHYQDAHPGTVQQWSTLPTRIDPIDAARPPEKIDYIFASRHLALENPRVPKDSLTDIISDHYPVSVDIRTESLK